MKHPKVAIIILNWNGLDDTIECLESLKKIAYPDYYVVTVDNGSEGNDAQVLKEKYGNYMHVMSWTPSLGQDRGNVKVGSRYPQGV
jgi:GT2 family glycosyltransferase